MGQCCSTENRGQEGRPRYTKHVELGGSQQAAAPKPQAITTTRQKQQHREANWRATGIVGLRDQGLAHIPQNALDVGDAARVLDATNNKIRELPTGLAQLTSLQRLVLANNQLSQIPGDVLACLVNLKFISLDSNRLVWLPVEIGRLPKLEKLTVNQNPLQALPDLSSLSKLVSLSAASCQLLMLPELPQGVEEVDVAHNQITVIPGSYSSLVNLKILNLDHNQVSSVPSEVLLHCAALHTLSLHTNPIVPDVLQSDPAYDAFEQRRRSKYNKVIAGGVLLGNKGLDEGVDRNATRS